MGQGHRSYAKVVDALPAGIVVCDRTGRVESWNPAAASILGIDPAQVIGPMGSPPGQRAVREDGTPLASPELPWVIALRTGQPIANVVLGLRRGDRTQLWISVSAQPIPDPGAGAPAGVAVSFFDVSERFRAERRLRSALAASEALVARFREELRAVKTLGGLVPVCSSCRAIRVDASYWWQIEAYVADHPVAQVAHGLCPDCEARLHAGDGR